MLCGNNGAVHRYWSRLATLKDTRTRGQMTVELAVCIPIILAVLGIALNVLGYMNVCARFDRVAADAVRSQASSPGYGEEGAALSASRVEGVIGEAFESGGGSGFDVAFTVSVSTSGGTGRTLNPGGSSEGSSASSTNGSGVGFSMLSRLERYECAVTYRPWPFSKIVFLEFFELTHTRSYTVDPFRPGVLL